MADTSQPTTAQQREEATQVFESLAWCVTEGYAPQEHVVVSHLIECLEALRAQHAIGSHFRQQYNVALNRLRVLESHLYQQVMHG